MFGHSFDSCLFFFLVDWVVSQGTVINSEGDLGLILTQANGGTRLASTRYVYYGTITAKRTLKHLTSVLSFSLLTYHRIHSQNQSLGWRRHGVYYHERH